MKPENLNALSKFDPTRGIHLVLRGKDDDQYIEAKEYKAFRIPFLGRMLAKIVYPSFRFKKVISYLLEKEPDLQGLEDKRKLFLQEKIKDYFNLNVDGQPSRHLKLWEKVSQSYKKVFSIEPIETLEQQPIARNISNYHLTVRGGGRSCEMEVGDIDEELFELPEYILSQLPPDENYVILPGCTSARPTSPWQSTGHNLLAQFKDYLKTRTDPIVIFILFPEWKGTQSFHNSIQQEVLEAFKNEGLIKNYCPLYRRYRDEWLEGEKFAGYEAMKKVNERSINRLKERLSSSEDLQYPLV